MLFALRKHIQMELWKGELQLMILHPGFLSILIFMEISLNKLQSLEGEDGYGQKL